MSGTITLPVDAAGFRVDYPEFADTTKYADVTVTNLLTDGATSFASPAWGDQWKRGVELFTAHFLALQARNGTGVPGSVGVLGSKSVGRASLSYDLRLANDAAAGQWNLTSYGIQLWRLIKLVGMSAPMQYTGNTFPPGTPTAPW